MRQRNDNEQLDLPIADDRRRKATNWRHAWRAFALAVFATIGMASLFSTGNAVMTGLLAATGLGITLFSEQHRSRKRKATPSIATD